jgi:hypothetical protein
MIVQLFTIAKISFASSLDTAVAGRPVKISQYFLIAKLFALIYHTCTGTEYVQYR